MTRYIYHYFAECETMSIDGIAQMETVIVDMKSYGILKDLISDDICGPAELIIKSLSLLGTEET